MGIIGVIDLTTVVAAAADEQEEEPLGENEQEEEPRALVEAVAAAVEETIAARTIAVVAAVAAAAVEDASVVTMGIGAAVETVAAIAAPSTIAVAAAGITAERHHAPSRCVVGHRVEVARRGTIGSIDKRPTNAVILPCVIEGPTTIAAEHDNLLSLTIVDHRMRLVSARRGSTDTIKAYR